MKPYKFIISGGGTGGHIYPAIAIADELKRQYSDAEFLFVGAKDRMEMEKVPQAGYPIEGLWISGLQRNLKLKNLSFPIKLISSLWKSRRIIRKFQPDAVVGTGGYASAPVLRVAGNRGVPNIIQEQNSHAGITNKWVSNKADKICVAYEQMERFFPEEKLVLTGNPVRQDLLDVGGNRSEAHQFFSLNPNKKTLLVLGGSLGARRINQLICDRLDLFEKLNLQVIWQCGKLYHETYQSMANESVQVHAFLNRMDLAYAAADIIISRAGALSVSELCLVGKPVVFIPSPNVAEDHQTKNAQAIVDQKAALMIRELELDDTFDHRFVDLVKDTDQQGALAQNIKALAKPNATKDIVAEIIKLIEPA